MFTDQRYNDTWIIISRQPRTDEVCQEQPNNRWTQGLRCPRATHPGIFEIRVGGLSFLLAGNSLALSQEPQSPSNNEFSNNPDFQTEEVNHINSWEEAMNFLFEGQLEKKTRERSTENVIGEPEPGAASRITARSWRDTKEIQPLYKTLWFSFCFQKSICVDVHISIISGNKHIFISVPTWLRCKSYLYN